MPDDRLIVALDLPTLFEAKKLVSALKLDVSYYKIGMRLFTSCGPDVVKMLRSAGAKVFLDLKFHDIPNTVAQACKSAVGLGVSMLNVHASGGREMLEAAAKAVNKKAVLVGVTVLTSQAGASQERVVELAKLCQECGLDGVVCAAQEAAAVRRACGDGFIIVTPGIRPASYGTKDDQVRVQTPKLAIENGSNYLVVGRPILQAEHPLDVVRKILSEIK
jgi:orotidine-5'-phosphate decarboxylase